MHVHEGYQVGNFIPPKVGSFTPPVTHEKNLEIWLRLLEFNVDR